MSSCYAYNEEYQRCDRTAGHQGDHKHTVQWDEAGCWSPDVPLRAHRGPEQHTPTEALGTGGDDWADTGLTVVPGTPEEAASTVPTCILCDHPKHPEGSCEWQARGLPRGTACGCLTSA